MRLFELIFSLKILFISCNVFFSQEKSNFIKYEVSGEYFEPLDTQSINEFLIFDKNKYYYFNVAFDDKRDVYDILKNYNIAKGSEKIFSTYNNNFIYQLVAKPNKSSPTLTKDYYNLNWRFLNEKKKILGYNCSLAETEFRGRKYYAYFTTEIPFPIGPWKFNNLPGIILEVYDKDKVYVYKATEISLNNNKIAIPNNVINFIKNEKTESYIDVVNLKTKQLEEIRNRQLSNLPKGTVIKNIEPIRKWLREVTF